MHHLDRECIALFGPVERHDDDGCYGGRGGRVVGDGDVFGGEVGVGVWERDGWWSGDHGWESNIGVDGG